jgi:hypothetical protein
MDSEFSAAPPEAIEWAFRSWRKTSPYMPAICEIHELLLTWHRLKRELNQEEKARLDKAATEDARERGELIDFCDVVARFAEITARTSEQALEEVAKPMPRAPLDIETMDPQQLRQTKEARKAELAAWKERASK